MPMNVALAADRAARKRADSLPDSLELKIQDVLAGGERLVDGIARIRAKVQNSRLPVSVVPVPEASPVTAPAREPFLLIGQRHEPLPIRDQVDRPVVSEVWPVDRSSEYVTRGLLCQSSVRLPQSCPVASL